MGKVISFGKFAKTEKQKSKNRIVSIEIYDEGQDEYSYRVRKGNKFSENMASFCTARVLRDIVEYTFGPEDILEAVDNVLARIEDTLGMENEFLFDDDEGED